MYLISKDTMKVSNQDDENLYIDCHVDITTRLSVCLSSLIDLHNTSDIKTILIEVFAHLPTKLVVGTIIRTF